MPQDSPLAIRDYQKGDEQSILNLYRLVFGPITEGYWRWRYLGNPYGASIIKLMFSGDELVGQYALEPFDFDIANRRVRACFALDAMTHPDHRGKGVLTSLGQSALRDAKELGYTLGYALLNSNSLPVFTKNLGWHSYGNVVELHLNLKEVKIRGTGDVRCSESFPRDTAQLWNSVRSKHGFLGVPRDSRFLGWRFAAASGVDYSFAESFGSRGELLGYAAMKVYQNETGHVVDMLADSSETADSLFASALEKFRGDGCRNFSCWLPSRLAQGLTIDGLSEQVNPRTFFVSKKLQEPTSEIHDRDSWFLMMADSDVY